MCGFFIHGFWWQENDDYVVVADWEINSHSKIREYRKDLIPANAQRWGFNPVNGEPLTNDSELLPEKVRDKICLLREMYFPNKEAIADWMKKNYGKQNDKREWELPLLGMLSDFGSGLFSPKYYKQWIKYYEQGVKDYEYKVRDYEQSIKYYEHKIRDYEQKIKFYEQSIKYYEYKVRDYEQKIKFYEQRVKDYEYKVRDYEQKIKDYKQWIKDCTGTLDKMDIDKFIVYFLEHTNSFWADRKEERKVEYESFVMC